MTCSTTAEELLARPVRMAFIQFEATFARDADECWWPEGSPEFIYWMDIFGAKENPPVLRLGGSQIPHQRDAEMASRSAGAILA
jgi:hypothetical protein